jgi:hypothetical protein
MPSKRGRLMHMELIEEALGCPRCIISVMGDHAGEGVAAIFNRKILDIGRVRKTFWVVKSPKAQPVQVQEMCRTTPAYVLFVAPATKGGARPTTAQGSAMEYSENRGTWHHFPNGLSPVTGKLDARTAALVFDILSTSVDATLDLWNYADFTDTQKPVKLILGCSTVCAVRKDMRFHSDKLKSRYRHVVAAARLAAPYCVWIR